MMEEAERLIREALDKGVKHANILFTSLTGKMHAVQIPLQEFMDASEQGVGFDGSSVGMVGIEESDLMLRPDPSSLRIAYWADPPVALATADIYEADKPSTLDPRYILKQAVRRLKEELGSSVEYYTSPEIEFWLFKETPGGDVDFQDRGGYFSLPPEDLGYRVRLEVASALDTIGIKPEKIHHEVPPGKHEIDFRYSDALRTADNVLFYKFTVRSVAAKHGLIGSFMPKPFYGQYGAGMHTHQSLYDRSEDRNLFHGDRGGLSDTALHFIGGLMRYAREITAITNPSVNSYKRLVPGWEAPVYITWARLNRSALIRVPMSTSPKRVRIEYRATDGSCNPYLAFAAMLMAGLRGIKEKIEPPEPVEKDIYHMSPEERREKGIETLPGNLGEALDELEHSRVAREVLGERAFKRYLMLKRKEWFEYNVYVHPWERRRYLYL